MVQLRKLMGTQSEGCFECMYTKHKTQKRKIWHDGYIQLNAMSRKVQLYEAVPPNAALVEEGTLTVYQWDRGNEEYISLTKHLIDILNFDQVTNNGMNCNTQKPHYTKLHDITPSNKQKKQRYDDPILDTNGFIDISKITTTSWTKKQPQKRKSVAEIQEFLASI